jgi:hypothetical protein
MKKLLFACVVIVFAACSKDTPTEPPITFAMDGTNYNFNYIAFAGKTVFGSNISYFTASAKPSNANNTEDFSLIIIAPNNIYVGNFVDTGNANYPHLELNINTQLYSTHPVYASGSNNPKPNFTVTVASDNGGVIAGSFRGDIYPVNGNNNPTGPKKALTNGSFLLKYN